MRKIHINSLVPGMKLAKTIFDMDGRVLLTSGIELKSVYINRLRQNSITELYIEDEVSQGIEARDLIHDNVRIEAKQIVKKLMQEYVFSSSLNVGHVKEVVDKIIEELLLNDDILNNLTDIKFVDDYTFEHSVSVCILSLIIGIDLGYSTSLLKELGIGAILHDIGKLKIPEEILKKPSQLTAEEFEQIKKHAMYGYEILRHNENVSSVSAYIAFAHHERYDGSGYPLKLKGENIHQCARIVAVADVYDALISDRVYRKKLRPHEVVEYISSLGTQHFDKEIVKSFLKFIVIYPVGSGVILNTREKGLVARVNKDVPTRPVVRILYDSEAIRLLNYHEIDLSKRKDINVIDTCNIII